MNGYIKMGEYRVGDITVVELYEDIPEEERERNNREAFRKLGEMLREIDMKKEGTPLRQVG